MLTEADERALGRIAVWFARGVDSMPGSPDTAGAIGWLRRGFAEDCRFEYRRADGELFANAVGLADFTAFGHAFMREKQYVFTLHQVSNVLIEEAGEALARIESAVVAYHRRPDASQDVAIARYLDEAVRTDGRWLCRQRLCRQLAFDNYAPAFPL